MMIRIDRWDNNTHPRAPSSTYEISGVTLRDLFAMTALAGVTTGEAVVDREMCAEHCYKLADAMLKAREESTK